MTVVRGPIGECYISFSKGRSLMGGGVPFSFAVLARCLSFFGTVSRGRQAFPDLMFGKDKIL